MHNNLKHAREAANKSQMQTAIYMDTTQAQLSKWENGRQDITLSRAARLAEYYNVSLDYLAGRTDEPRNPNVK